MIRTRRQPFISSNTSLSTAVLQLALSTRYKRRSFFGSQRPLVVQERPLAYTTATDTGTIGWCHNGVIQQSFRRQISQLSSTTNRDETTTVQEQQEKQQQQQQHKKYYPNSFVYRRGDHPYGTREYLLVRPKPILNDDSNDDDTSTTDSSRQQQNIIRFSAAPGTTQNTGITSTVAQKVQQSNELQVLAALHANNNIVFGAKVMMHHNNNNNNNNNKISPSPTPPSILDLCPILLRTALLDCSNEGEQPQALATLHGLSQYVRQCLEDPMNNNNNAITSKVIQTLHEQINNSTTLRHNASSKIDNNNTLEEVDVENENNYVEILECITAIATNIPRPGHSVVGQRTYAIGSKIWAELAREYVLLSKDDENNNKNNRDHPLLLRSEECLLYQTYCTETCELVDIELLADTSPSYLQSAGGAMARFFIQ